MLQKIRELYAVLGPFPHAPDCWPGAHVWEPGMFMKTNQIVELTWNVTENKRAFPLSRE